MRHRCEWSKGLTWWVFLTALTAWGCGGTSVSDPGSALGEGGQEEALEEALADEGVAAAGIGIARSVLYGEPMPARDTLAALPGRRAFVCAYQEKPQQICQTGVGDDLAASIEAAATALKKEAGNKIDAGDAASVRLKLDVVTRSKDRTFDKEYDKPKKRRAATYGYYVTGDGGGVSWLLPSEILEKGLHDRKKGCSRKGVLRELKRRNGGLGDLPDGFAFDEFETIAWVEKDEPGQTPPGVFRLYRLHPYEFPEATTDAMLQSMVWAADYLVSSVSAEGKIRYHYLTYRDKDSRSYNLIRHAGTTYSLLQIYDRTRFEPYRLAAEKAMLYLFDHCDRDVRTGPWLSEDHPDFGDSLFVVSLPRGKKEGDVHLGGAGLGLVMIDQYVEATGDTETYREQARAMGRFLVASQKADGEFLSFPARHAGGPPCRDEVSPYYPGEAILGLARLYSWDPNPLWLDTAVRAADWLIDVRDKGKNETKMANDHWLMLGLSYLYFYTEDPRYVAHSKAICQAVDYQYHKNEKAWAKYPDYRGGYYDPPRSTPAATRGEGLGAVLETCRLAGEECDWIEFLLKETVQHEMLSQYDPDMSFWMPNRAKAFGAFNGGLLDTSTRNDFVQHNMSSLLGYERHLLRKESVEVPGGPGWMEKRLEGTEYPGLAEDALARLRAETLRYRGVTYWEKQAAEATEAAEPDES